MFKAIKSKLNKLLESIAAQNAKSFGTQKLDCCDLNKDKDKTKAKDSEK